MQNLHARSNVYLPCSGDIIHESPDDHSAVHDARVVHALLCDRYAWWEEGEDDCDECVSGCEDVDGQTPAAECPGSKLDLLVAEALDDHQDDGDRVGGEEAGDDEGDDCVECDGGADLIRQSVMRMFGGEHIGQLTLIRPSSTFVVPVNKMAHNGMARLLST